MVPLFSTPLEAAQVLQAIHGCGVGLRSLCYASASAEELVRHCRDDDARLNELLSGRVSASDFLRATEVAYGRGVGFEPSRWGDKTWLGRDYAPGEAMAFAHATRAFLKAVAWEAEAGAPTKRLEGYFDAMEHIPLELMHRGPAWTEANLAAGAETMAPFVNASAAYRAFRPRLHRQFSESTETTTAQPAMTTS